MWRITLFFRNLYLHITVKLLRVLFKLKYSAALNATNAHSTLQIPSRDNGRTITANLYTQDTTRSDGTSKSKSKSNLNDSDTFKNSPSKPQPILLNLHGSGMIFPAFKMDDEFCKHITKNTPYAVLDIQYRLSPENPFPAALNDVEDVITWILSQPDSKYDKTRLSISGFSAGGNLAIAAATSSALTLPPRPKTFKFDSVLAFYPGTDLFSDPGQKVAPDPVGKMLPARMARFFFRCYVPVGIDARDPRISPLFGDLAAFSSRRLLMITAARDNMAAEAEEFAGRVRDQSGCVVVMERMEGCEHAWDKVPDDVCGVVQREAKWRAYGMAVEMLSSGQ